MLPIYIDFDDVLSETTLSFIKILKREFGREVSIEEITSFSFQEAFELSETEFDYLFNLLHQTEEVLNYKPVNGALDVLENWSKKGYNIAIVTGRLTSTYEASLEWLSNQKFPYDSFFMVDKYSRPNTDMNIAISIDELSSMNFSFAIEDSLSMAEYLSKEMKTKVALFDRPWNQAKQINEKVERCSCWEDISNFVK